MTHAPARGVDILELARDSACGRGLDRAQTLEILRLPDDRLEDLLSLAHDVRMTWCGPEVEVEGIISLKTGGCSRGLPLLFPVRTVRLARPPRRGST